MQILAAVDGSVYTRRMLAYIAAHDEWLGAHHQYTLVHAVAALPSRAAAAVDKATVRAWYADSAEKVFKPLRTFFERQGLQARFVAHVGHAAHVIADSAAKLRPDLVVMGTHGHGALANLVLGSVATQVLARCTTPVLLIR